MIWTFFTGTKLGRWIATIAAVAIAFLGYGKLKEREGAKDANAKRDMADKLETIKAHEVRNEVEDRIDRAGDARKRLRDHWSK